MKGSIVNNISGNKIKFALFATICIFIIVFALILVSKTYYAEAKNVKLKTCTLDTDCKSGGKCINKKCVLNTLPASSNSNEKKILLVERGKNSLPRIDSIEPAEGLPGTTVIITGEGFNKKEDNLIIFKVIGSPLSFYDGKAGAEYKMNVLPKSIDGRTIQFSIPFSVYSLPRFADGISSAIPLILGEYEIIVANNTQDYNSLGLDGIKESNGIKFEIQAPKTADRYPTKINITSPKGGETWKIGDFMHISWEDISVVQKLDVYAYTNYYRFDETHAGFYFQKVKMGVNGVSEGFDWKVNLNESISYNYSSPQEIYNIPWLPDDGKLETYLIIQGINSYGLVYKDVSNNFTIATPLVGSCNGCPGEINGCFEGGRRSCQKINGCWKWSSVISCKAGEICANGACIKG